MEVGRGSLMRGQKAESAFPRLDVLIPTKVSVLNSEVF